jgi:hypothetical protein
VAKDGPVTRRCGGPTGAVRDAARLHFVSKMRSEVGRKVPPAAERPVRKVD